MGRSEQGISWEGLHKLLESFVNENSVHILILWSLPLFQTSSKNTEKGLSSIKRSVKIPGLYLHFLRALNYKDYKTGNFENEVKILPIIFPNNS